MKVSVISRTVVKAMIALFIRARCPELPDTAAMGRKIVTRNVFMPPSFSTQHKQQQQPTTKGASVMGASEKYPKKAALKAKADVRKRTCGKKNKDAFNVLKMGASLTSSDLFFIHQSEHPFVTDRMLAMMPTYWMIWALLSPVGPIISWM